MATQSGPNLKFALFAMAGILAAHVFIFTPVTLYAGNSEEFTTPLPGLLKLWLVPALSAFIVFVVLGTLLPGGIRIRYACALGALGILCWMQSTLLVWDYGLLDGRAIDWSTATWRGWVDGGIWVLTIVLVLRLPPSRYIIVYRAAVLVFLVHLTATALLLFEVRDKLMVDSRSSNSGSMAEALRFSSDSNVLHVLLDGFQADVFQDLIEHPQVGPVYRQAFDGFVFYNETLSAFPYTQFSIPSYLSGRIFTNQQPKDDFLDKVLSEKTILSAAMPNNSSRWTCSSGIPILPIDSATALTTSSSTLTS